MKFGLTVFLFFIFSVLLVFFAVNNNINSIHNVKMEEAKINNTKVSSSKLYSRSRKEYIPRRSFSVAQKEIKNILLKEPIHFAINSSDVLKKSTLIKISKIVNHVKEKIVLSILAHTDVSGVAKYNLNLSQKRADMLKKYFVSKTNLPLIVAIGYGEAFALKNRLIEINLKRIK